MGTLRRVFHELLRRLSLVRQRETWERELDEEMQFHVDMREHRNTEAGASADEAHLDAVRRFGNATLLRERSREAWIAPWIEAFLKDSRIAFRSMARNP